MRIHYLLFEVFSLSVLMLVASRPVLAIYNPLLVPNNKFGIHILESSDIEAAADLVNASPDHTVGWGYVTLVIQDNDKNIEKWSQVFNKLRYHHLIPLVRLATHGESGNVWAKPKEDEITVWVDFLDRLPWPVKNRYVILFNEPNHAREWGGALAPDEYAHIASLFADSLHKKNNQFFVLPSGFDVHADGISGTMEATEYWRLMEKNEPGIFAKFDGWNSHSYPKDFSASPHETGRYSIKGYLWELTYLASKFSVSSRLPVFITETGWSKRPSLSSQTIADYYRTAYESIWVENNLVAVTPFLLNYPQQPFVGFSWKKPGENEFFPQYLVVRDLVKVLGEPLTVPFSRFGALLTQQREDKLLKRLQVDNLFLRTR